MSREQTSYITSKDYERRNRADNQLQVKLEAGSQIQAREIVSGLGIYEIKTSQPCTKNGSSTFNLTEEELKEIT